MRTDHDRRIVDGLAMVAAWEREQGAMTAEDLAKAAEILAEADRKMFGDPGAVRTPSIRPEE